ncbi:MAG: S8 family serine peptidase [Candidatus Izemoplasmatales bacterium]|jgi:hypothetical protein
MLAKHSLKKFGKLAFAVVMTAFLLVAIVGLGKGVNYETEYLYRVSSHAEADELCERFDLELVEVSPAMIATFRGDAGDQELLRESGFALNETSYLLAPPWQSTTDPYLKDQYGLTVTSTDDAWAIETGSSAIVVAIIDTGIDTDHPEFAGRIMVESYNSRTKVTGIAAVEDDYGHGTMAAGVIGAVKDNSQGIAGITQNVKLMIIKANNIGVGSFTDSAIIEGIYYAVDHGARIINLSLGSTYANPLTEEAIEYATLNDVIVVAASGNDGNDDLIYPASFADAISVGAIDQTLTIADFSNYNNALDMTAPGADIITTAMAGGYATVSGTSFASPHVAGILALLVSHEPEISIPELRSRLFLTAIDRGTPGWDPQYGHGVVEAYELLTEPFVEISFNAGGDLSYPSVWIKQYSTLSDTFEPEITEMIFLGWYLDSNYQTPFTEDETVFTVDTTLYARFASESVAITLMNGSVTYATEVILYGETYTPEAGILEGYNFLGWYLDPGFITPYEPSMVETDLVLYARFEAIIYHEVTLMLGEEIYALLTVEAGMAPELPVVGIEGHEFVGWYLDSGFVTIYELEAVMAPLVLYAKLDLMEFSVTLINPHSEPAIVSAFWGLVPDLPEVVVDGYDFAGWYLDQEYTERYLNEPIYDDLILYASFETGVFEISVMIDEAFAYSLYVEAGQRLTETVVIEGYDFLGWYLDSQYLMELADTLISEDLTLYAKLETIRFTVTFYDDLGTIISTTEVIYGEAATAPNAPLKADTVAFSYLFTGWDSAFDQVLSDLDIHPLYERTFKPNSVSLIPGIDTILTNQVWVDYGVRLLDTALTMQKTGNVTSATPGRYVVSYDILYQEEIVYTLSRIVNVREAGAQIEITLNKGISTIFVGEIYEDAGARTNIGTIEKSGSVDTTEPGVYKITYTVRQNGYVYQKSRYVYVIEASDSYNALTMWFKKEEIDDEA